GLSDAKFAAFDRSGKYLYVAASTDTGLTIWFGNMSGMNRPVTSSVYLIVLRKDLPSPLAPESDEEKGKEPEKPKTEDKSAENVRIDFDRISQRILALPLPMRHYTALVAGKAGTLFLQEGQPIGNGPQTLHKFDLTTRKVEKVLDGVGG